MVAISPAFHSDAGHKRTGLSDEDRGLSEPPQAQDERTGFSECGELVEPQALDERTDFPECGELVEPQALDDRPNRFTLSPRKSCVVR